MKKAIIKYFKDSIEYNGDIYIKQTDITDIYGYECYVDSEYKMKLEMRRVIDDDICINNPQNSKKRSNQNKEIYNQDDEEIKVKNSNPQNSKKRANQNKEIYNQDDEEIKVKNSKLLYLVCPIIILVNIVFR